MSRGQRRQACHGKGANGPKNSVVHLHALREFANVSGRHAHRQRLYRTRRDTLGRARRRRRLRTRLSVPRNFRVVGGSRASYRARSKCLTCPVTAVTLRRVKTRTARGGSTRTVDDVGRTRLDGKVSLLDRGVECTRRRRMSTHRRRRVNRTRAPRIAIPRVGVRQNVLHVRLDDSLLHLSAPHSSQHRCGPLLPSTSPHLPKRGSTKVLT